jgi:hypothetical protein
LLSRRVVPAYGAEQAAPLQDRHHVVDEGVQSGRQHRMRWARHAIENLYQRQLRPDTQSMTGPVDPHRMPTPQSIALAA